MSHVSIKLKLNHFSGEQTHGVLKQILAASSISKTVAHSDDVYRINPNTALKVRTYKDGRQEIICERLNYDSMSSRYSRISVAFVRRNERDNDPRDVLGDPQFHLGKKRTSYEIKDFKGLRVYFDQLEDGQIFFELQLDDNNEISLSAAETLKNYVLSLGFEEKDIIHDSYEDIFLSSVFNEKTRYTPAYKMAPYDLKRDVLNAPQYCANSDHTIFTKGDVGTFAVLITKGQARVPIDGVFLCAGQLVGEFSSLEQGLRTADVIADKGLQGYRVEGRLLERLMEEVPANAQKYFDWRRNKADFPSRRP